MKLNNTLSILLSCSNLFVCYSDSALDFFAFMPKSDFKHEVSQQTEFSQSLISEGKSWNKHLSEKDVFMASLSSQGDKSKSWKIKIGKGGQIYSFIGSFGESIPPQNNAYELKNNLIPKSQWIDEVWQSVAVCSKKNNHDRIYADLPNIPKRANLIPSMKYFIHQAGTYRKDRKNPELTYYSPLLQSAYNEKEKSFYCLNWGQQAHIPSIHNSSVLYYTKYRDCGGGVLEVTSLLHNYGDDVISYINNPWGGVRTSSLPEQWLSDKKNKLTKMSTKFGDKAALMPKLNETGGYFVWSQSGNSEKRPALAIVFGNGQNDHALKKKLIQPTRLRFGTAGTCKVRDYSVLTVNQRVSLGKNESFYNRYYFVTGPRDYVIKTAQELQPHQDYGFCQPMINQTKNTLSPTPFKSSQPLFLMRDLKTGLTFKSSNPYSKTTPQPFQNPYQPNDPKFHRYQDRQLWRHYQTTEYIKLLGFVDSSISNLNSIRKEK